MAFLLQQPDRPHEMCIRDSNYYNHTIAFMLEDSEIKETIRPYIMARIVDFEAFLAQYQFSDHDHDDALTFIVQDPVPVSYTHLMCWWPSPSSR